jgi:LacI family transcriptional regulator
MTVQQTTRKNLKRKATGITIKDVATHAGVSLTTASAALHHTGRISDQRRSEILKVASEIGYQPRTAARLMRSKQTGHLGLVINQVDPLSAFRHGNHRHYIAHFIQSCEERNIPYHLDFCNISKEDTVPPRHAAGGLVDGILVLGDDVDRPLYDDQPSPMHQWLKQFDKPAITLSSHSHWSVLSDTEEGIFLAMQQLHAMGHRRIGFVSGDEMYKYNQVYHDGFIHAVNALKMTTRKDWQIAVQVTSMGTSVVMDDVLEQTRKMLSSKDRPTAFYCNGGEKMRAVIEAARQVGLDVPAQISVVGNCSAIYACDGYPRLSAVHRDVSAIIEHAIDMLKQCIADPDKESQSLKIVPKLTMRQTIGPVTSTP